jgi:hypothetical protein
MAAETAFLTAVATYLGAGTLSPAPKSIGIAEPEHANELPAVVLWLEQTSRAGGGVGERSALITDSVLPWQATIDLADPVLPEDPSFRLLSDDRTVLTLPHGGLVKQDGSSGALTAADLTVTVAGASRSVVNVAPVNGQVRADPLVGQLTFGQPLPPTGPVVTSYFLGQWERRVSRISGTLSVDIYGADAGAVTTLTDGVLGALLPEGARPDINGLKALALASLSSIAPKVSVARKRSASFAFVYEHQIDQPDSSGGIIRQIPIATDLEVASVDAAGAVQTSIVSTGS